MHQIRRATPADQEAMVALIASLFSFEPDFAVDNSRQAAGLAALLADRERSVVLVAESAGQVVGMLTVQLLISTAQGGWSGLVEDVVVSEACRGMGIGRALVDAAEKWVVSHGGTRIQLLVDSENAPAVGFYAHQGYEATRMVCRRKFLAQGS